MIKSFYNMISVDDSIEKLRFFFPETLLLAALDLIDRDSGEYTATKHTSPCD